eukprot:scaffold3061_cov430-Prasinococcus_capsulatus_cf.AAC.1
MAPAATKPTAPPTTALRGPPGALYDPPVTNPAPKELRISSLPLRYARPDSETAYRSPIMPMALLPCVGVAIHDKTQPQRCPRSVTYGTHRSVLCRVGMTYIFGPSRRTIENLVDSEPAPYVCCCCTPSATPFCYRHLRLAKVGDYLQNMPEELPHSGSDSASSTVSSIRHRTEYPAPTTAPASQAVPV